MALTITRHHAPPLLLTSILHWAAEVLAIHLGGGCTLVDKVRNWHFSEVPDGAADVPS